MDASSLYTIARAVMSLTPAILQRQVEMSTSRHSSQALTWPVPVVRRVLIVQEKCCEAITCTTTTPCCNPRRPGDVAHSWATEECGEHLSTLRRASFYQALGHVLKQRDGGLAA